jgi:DNA-directed RNA polymerase subunit RPC12/RpoP
MSIVGMDGQPQQSQQGQPLDINLGEQPDIVCETCSGKYFELSYTFKKISKLLTGEAEDKVAPIQLFRCMECGTPCKDLMPSI